jgi:hypothetical protein
MLRSPSFSGGAWRLKNMEILGTNFTLTLGGWRLRFVLAIEDSDAAPVATVRPPHRMRVVPEDEYAL